MEKNPEFVNGVIAKATTSSRNLRFSVQSDELAICGSIGLAVNELIKRA